MELEDIRAAIRDLDRQQTKMMKQRQHRLDLAARYTAEAAEIERTLVDVQDRWLALIQRERDTVDGADGGE